MDAVGLPMQIKSEDGRTYTLDGFKASGANLRYLWDMFHKFPVLFCDQTTDDYASFVRWVLEPSTVLLTVDDVGIVYVTRLIPGLDAIAHYFFWDRQTQGRHRVILRALRWGVDTFNLRRYNIEIPRHAVTTLHRAHKIGFRFEGVRRQGQLHQGKWHDVILFGVLDDELTPLALEIGRLDRTESERGWFGYLNKDATLMQFISRG